MRLLAAAQPFINWGYVADHITLIEGKVVEHIKLTGEAVALGFMLALPLGIFSHRHGRVYGLISSVTGILYTIPSLTLFVILLPITGLHDTTVVIPLAAYTLLILIRNIVAGLRGVPDDVKEAASGMGYSSAQILWRVELPLALPVIVAGIRIATVSTIGLVTVGALVGKGGLGYFILDGLRGLFITEILVGAVLSMALALLADGVLLLGERALTPWARTRRVRAVA